MRRASTPGAGGRWTAAVGLGIRARVSGRARLLSDEGYWRAHTERVQGEQLLGLLRRASGTEFGREHGFARLAGIEDAGERLAAYRSAVPLREWYGFKDRLARMREGGEGNVLWPGLVRDFCQTSGTTAGDKFIPLSEEMLRSNFRASLDIFAYLMNRGVSLSRMTSGRCLFMGGSSDVRANEHGVRTGDLSGLVTRLIRWPLSEVYSPGPEIALIGNWKEKIEAMAQLTVGQDIRFISGMPSWALVLMGRVLELARERGARAGCVRDVWPGLEVFVHGGVKYGPFVRRVNELVFGDAGVDFPVRHELYPASEAFIAMQDGVPEDPEQQASLRVMSDIGNFLEFVPLEEIERADARAVTVSGAERGQRYVVVLTTCAGLWRYVIGDVVEFDSVPAGLDGRGGWPGAGGPARLRIVGRHRHFINAFGENLIVEHIERAVMEACASTGAVVGEFTAGPVYPSGGERAGLELVVEWLSGPGASGAKDGLGERFGAAFDASLKAQNVDYTTKRGDDLGMGPPTVTRVAAGSFHRWMASRGKLGGQHKCPRCANHREYIEGVRGISGVGGVR